MERIADDDGAERQRGEFGGGEQFLQRLRAQHRAGKEVSAGVRGFLQHEDAAGAGRGAGQPDGARESRRSRADDEDVRLQMGLARMHGVRIAQRTGKTRR